MLLPFSLIIKQYVLIKEDLEHLLGEKKKSHVKPLIKINLLSRLGLLSFRLVPMPHTCSFLKLKLLFKSVLVSCFLFSTHSQL